MTRALNVFSMVRDFVTIFRYAGYASGNEQLEFICPSCGYMEIIGGEDHG